MCLEVRHLLLPSTASLKGKMENWAENRGISGLFVGRGWGGSGGRGVGGGKERKELLTGVEESPLSPARLWSESQEAEEGGAGDGDS